MQNYNQSILSLFDPLHASAAPERDASSPEPSSDKENDGPSAGQVTVFFNRVYKHTPLATAKSPKGKLIDYDLTVMSQQNAEDSMDEDEGGMILDGLEEDTENQRVAYDEDMEMQDENAEDDTLQIPLSRRQPLADIQLDSVLGSVPEPEPIPVEGSPESSMWDEGSTTIPAITPAPPSAPLANVINSINFAALSIHATESSHDPYAPDSTVDNSGCPTGPEIAVIAPESSHTSPTSNTPQRLFLSHLSPAPSVLSSATRRLSPTTSATDPRRASVDLQSSFRLQLQNAEMTFDLLNDKISFLGHDSFWTGTDDDSIVLKKEEKAMMAIAEECERQISHSPEQTAPFSAPAQSPVFSLPRPSEPSVERRRSLPSAPVATGDEARAIPSEAPEPHPLAVQDSLTSSPLPAIHVTPITGISAVPALRIVKKAWKMHDRVNSVSSTTSSSSASSVTSVQRPGSSASVSSSTSSSSSSRAESVPAKRPAPLPREDQRTGEPPVPEMQKARTVIKGIQRPPPGAHLPPMQPMGPAKMRVTSGEASTGRRVSMNARPGALGIGKMGPPSLPPQRPAASKFPTSTFGVTSRLPGIGGSQLPSRATSSTIPSSSSGSFRPARSGGHPVVPSRSGLPVPQSRIPSAPGTARGTAASRLPTGTAASRRLP